MRRELTLVVLFAASVQVTVIGGCTHGGEAQTTELEPLDASENEELVDELAHSPEFVAYEERVIALETRATKALAEMTPAQRAAAHAAAVDLLADARADGADFNELAPRMQALTGVSASDLLSVKNHAVALARRFPQLRAAGPALFGQAVEDNLHLSSLSDASAVTGDLPDDETAECLQDCNEEYRSDHNIAGAIWWIQNLLCLPLGVGAPLCMLEALVQWQIAEAEARADHDDCREICLGQDPDGECEDDADCDQDEWCDTGALGSGDNECKPDRSIGQVCSRDAKCPSDCCRFDFWQNPVSMTCNPASDCN
jgi:hypothetical protein